MVDGVSVMNAEIDNMVFDVTNDIKFIYDFSCVGIENLLFYLKLRNKVFCICELTLNC